jgi:hypothetical protein
LGQEQQTPQLREKVLAASYKLLNLQLQERVSVAQIPHPKAEAAQGLLW